MNYSLLELSSEVNVVDFFDDDWLNLDCFFNCVLLFIMII